MLPGSRALAVLLSLLLLNPGYTHTQDRQIDGDHESGTLLMMISAELYGGETTALAGLVNFQTSNAAYFLNFTGSPVVTGKFALFYPPKDGSDPGLVDDDYELTAQDQYAYGGVSADGLIALGPNTVRANTHTTSVPGLEAVNDTHTITGDAPMMCGLIPCRGTAASR